jgi:lysophospholipid acyltransferase (LPLAT)-like uncharacterized protein
LSIAKYAQQMAPGTIVALDGSLSPSRRVKEGVVVLMELKQKKILGHEVVVNQQPGSPQHFEGLEMDWMWTPGRE